MEIGKFFLNEFTVDKNVRKKGDEAIVFKASHPRLGEVAVKRWLRNAYNSDNKIKLVIQNCNHPNIIQFVGMLMNSKSSYIGYIMPYMPMGNLHDAIHNKAVKYNERQISSWITQICCGLSHLHFVKILHWNIKPSNVLLGKNYDDVKLSDFGVARSFINTNHTLAKLGTPLYMAPEIFEGGKYDFSADIYSLSITIWEILHRREPYDHITLKFVLFRRIHKGERPQLDNNLSKEVSDLLKRCWDADASKRPTIDYVHEFYRKTTFSLVGLENAVNEWETSFQHLNVHNNHSESLTQIPSKKPNESSSEEQTILLVGGEDEMGGDSLLMLENNGQNWKEMSIKLPYDTHSHGAQFLNNNLYIFGGCKPPKNFSNQTHKLSKRPQYEEMSEIDSMRYAICLSPLFLSYGELNSAYKLSRSLQWENIADMNNRRFGISKSSVVLNNQIWVCGGKEYSFLSGLKSVEMYDPETNTWKYMKEMNEGRSEAVAAVVNGKIFCCGGEYRYSVECYDPSSDVWTLISNMPQKIWKHGAVEMNGHFIVIGGSNEREDFKNVWALDTTDKDAKWIEKPSMSIPRSDFSIAKIHDKIFVCGQNNKNVEIFDGEVWRNGPTMRTTRRDACAVVIPMEFARYLN